MLTKLQCLVVLAVLALPVGMIGCKDSKTETPAKDAGKVYDIKGKVISLDAAKKTVTIDHEDIPGLMKAMKMDFEVENEKVLSGLVVGDAVRGKLKVQGDSYIVTSLEKHAGGTK